ncbi:MAG: hypothetical protein GEV06_05585 [Luteitalea sp.]|nr:hypothetical protein [Luteitalea sp.]
MVRTGISILAVVLTLALLDAGANDVAGMPARAVPDAPESKVKTWTGWFSDLQCAAPRIARGDIGPNNPDCVKRCLKDGVTPVFISEQARALFEVRDYPSVSADVGYHIELTGTLDEAGKAISVRSVKRLEYVGAFCALPNKNAGRK